MPETSQQVGALHAPSQVSRDVPSVVGFGRVSMTDGGNIKYQGNVPNDVSIILHILEKDESFQCGDVPMTAAEMRGHVRSRIRR